jgi:hypothetical protein
MKNNFKFFLLLTFFALLTFNSCQNETIEVNEPNDQETIVPNSVLANLMLSASSNNGALDDILDNANCLAINLPVTIIVNDITITINTLADLELIVQIFEEFENDEDVLEFLFPIAVVLNDYTEITINNEDELESFIDECTEDDDVIECVDFQYPISFSLYNADFQITDTVIIENDEALYVFLESLENSNEGVVLASLNFPVTLIYANGETLEVDTNQELEAAINAAEGDCEDVEEDCTEDDVAMYLQECYWRMVSFNGDDNFIQYQLFFNENGTLEIIDGATTVAIGGNWNMSTSNDGLPEIVISELTAFSDDLEGSWIVVDCGEDRFELVREIEGNTTTIVIEQECEDDIDCSAQEISDYLQECMWYAGTNLYDNTIADSFEFTENGIVIITNPTSNETLTGAWNVSLTDSGVFITLDLPEPYSVISLEWKVVECEAQRIEMLNENNYLVFERDCNEEAYDCEEMQANFGDDCETPNGVVGFINENCECQIENTNPFECFTSFEAQLVECDGDTVDGYALFNLTNAFANCIQANAHTVTYHETIADADANVNAIPNPSEYANIVEASQTVYIRVELNESAVFEIFEISLIVENCNTGNCTEEEVDAYLTECHWNIVNYNNSNDLIEYDFDFNTDGIVTITGSGATYTGFWSTSQSANGVIVEFSNISGPNIQAINGNWFVVECEENRLEMHINNDIMVLERDCN